MTTLDTLTNTINQQLELLHKLDDVLSQEQQSLEGNQFDQLEAILSSKVHLLEELRQLEIQQFKQTQDITGNSNEFTPLKKLLEELALPDQAPLLQAEKSLSLLANQCSDKNKINGIMIHSRRRVNQRFIQILQNRLEPNQASTYGRNGETSTSFNAATSVQA